MKQTKKFKAVKAWAIIVLPEEKDLRNNLVNPVEYNDACSIFLNEKSALKEVLTYSPPSDFKVIPVLITPLTPKPKAKK